MHRPPFWTVLGCASALVMASLATVGTVQAAPAASHDAVIHPVKPKRDSDASARRAATSDRTRVARALGLGAQEQLVVKNVISDPDGTRHVRYDRTYAGLPVIGGDLVVHETKSGELTSTDRATKDTIAVASTQATVSQRSLPGRSARKVIYAAHHAPVLAWQTRVTGIKKDQTPINDLVYTDARTGKRLGVLHQVMTDGTGHSLYSGDVALTTTFNGAGYDLTDGARGGHKTYDYNNNTGGGTGTLFTDADNLWGNGLASSRQSAAVDAAYGAAKTWDFYQHTFGRNGIDDDGVAAYSRVHYDVGYDNAFWDNSCFCMTYGDGGSAFKPVVALDVAGHEMTHGVTAASNGLEYDGDAGGLNESTSDVMGTMVEFYANNSSDPGDYYIGEKIVKSGTALRRMDNPGSDGRSRNCWSKTVKKLDPHYSSGVGNHLFYLLAEGTGSKTIGGLPHKATSCNKKSVTGVGRTAAAAIWYRAMTVYFVSTESYPQAGNAMVNSARDLYGKNSTTCKRTLAAWKAVSVSPSAKCSTTRRNHGTSANAVANPGFESGTASWHQSRSTLIDNDGSYSRTGSWYVYLPGYYSKHSDTVSQTLTVPSGGTSMLRFYLLVNTNRDPRSAGYDKLSVKVKSGRKTKTIKTYNNTDYSYGSYDLRSVDLSAYHGKRVTLSFVTNSNVDGYYASFQLDDVSVRSTR